MGECLVIRSGSGVDTSTANATFDTIVSGYSCYVNDELVIGSIPINTINDKLSSDDAYNIQYGYYDNKNLISTSTLKEETVATAVSSDILKTYKGWANGIYIDGNIPNLGAISQALSVNTSYMIPQGWHNGGKVTQTLSTQAGINVTPGTTNKVACVANKWVTGDIWIVGDNKFISDNIKNGINIFGKVGTWTGYVDNPLQLNGLIPVQTLTEYDIGVSSRNTIVDVHYGGKSSSDSTQLAKIINMSGYSQISMKFTSWTSASDWWWEVKGGVTYWTTSSSFYGTSKRYLTRDIEGTSTNNWSFTCNELKIFPSFTRFEIWACLVWHKALYGAYISNWSAWLTK